MTSDQPNCQCLGTFASRIAKVRLALLCLRGERPSRHAHAIGLFDLRFVKEHIFDKEFSAWLHEAFDLWQRADYREMVVIAPERAKEGLDMAAKFLDETRKYFQDKLT